MEFFKDPWNIIKIAAGILVYFLVIYPVIIYGRHFLVG